MSWINKLPPRIKSIWRTQKKTGKDLWEKCAQCNELLLRRTLEQNLYVCPDCNHHFQISPKKRFKYLFDGGLYTEIAVSRSVEDPLGFKDQSSYSARIRKARKATGEQEAMAVARGRIKDTPIIAAAQNFKFMGGSMGIFVGNAVVTACRTALEENLPLVVFTAAGGARMQEGILSLMQMPRTTAAVQSLRSAGLPYVVVLTHPTTGGVTASFAMLGDIQIAEPNALICFAGPRVIEQTIREQLPEGFQRAEYLLKHGMLDRVTERRRLRGELASILRMLQGMDRAREGSLEVFAAS